MKLYSRVFAAYVLAAVLCCAVPASADDLDQADGRELYQRACATCHGADGRGAPPGLLGFDTPLPDFTDCTFASREPAADWVIVAHEGGPIRGFDSMMPAFGDALTMEQLERVVDFVKNLCTDHEWPPGDFNLPKALVTGKAYPEDETMISGTFDIEDEYSLSSKLIHEKRFGARNQWEIVIPFSWWEVAGDPGSDETDWTSGIGDIAFALKRAFYHNLEQGTILAVTGEVILPTGDEDRGAGSGTTVFEPFLTWGQILPADWFFQSQLGYKAPFDRDLDDQAFLRMNIGRSITDGPFGRTFSPMLGLACSRDLASGETTYWDAIPQMQFTLNQRQHIMMNIGVRLPINDSDHRDTKVMVYFLWDWFDGGLNEGW